MKCEYCGEEFTPQKGPGRPRKYCSDDCRYDADVDNKRMHYVWKSKRETHCVQCGCELPKFKTRFCSDSCQIKWQRVKAGINIELLNKSCVICGEGFETFKSRQKTCSEECSKILKNQHDQERGRKKYAESHPDYISQEDRHKAHLERLDRLEKEKAEKKEIRAKEQKTRQKILAEKEAIKKANIAHWLEYENEHICKTCQKPYIAHYPLSLYCSKKCQRKQRPKDRKRLKGKVIDKDISLLKLAERDKGICQICGLEVRWDDIEEKDQAIIAGDYYPSIDHIIPLSKGGMHSWDNVQLAHRKCNSYKCDKIIKIG